MRPTARPYEPADRRWVEGLLEQMGSSRVARLGEVIEAASMMLSKRGPADMSGVENAGDAVSGDLALLFGADDHDPHGLPPHSGLRGGYRRRRRRLAG